MSETCKVHCPHCESDVDAEVTSQVEATTFYNKPVECEVFHATCPQCGAMLECEDLADKNLQLAANAYRAAYNVPTPEELADFRKSYHLSLREFARFLGFGEQTYYRYEHGKVPADTHLAVIREAMTPEGAAALLRKNGEKLQARSVDAVRVWIAQAAAGSDHAPIVVYTAPEDTAANDLNGNKPFDLDAFKRLAWTMASRCEPAYWPRVMLAVFAADQLTWANEGHSLTGLRYRKTESGPVAVDQDLLKAILERDGVLSFRLDPEGFAVIAVPQQEPAPAGESQQTIDQAAAFANSLASGKEVSALFDSMGAWNDASAQSPVSYGLITEQLVEAIGSKSTE